MYFTYKSVPELRGLSSDERKFALLSAGKSFGKTRYFWLSLSLNILFTFGFGAISALLAKHFFHLSQTGALWVALIVGWVGYAIAFQFRIFHLRRHIAQQLSSLRTTGA